MLLSSWNRFKLTETEMHFPEFTVVSAVNAKRAKERIGSDKNDDILEGVKKVTSCGMLMTKGKSPPKAGDRDR